MIMTYSLGVYFFAVIGAFVLWYLFFDGDSWIRFAYRRLKRKYLGGLQSINLNIFFINDGIGDDEWR